MTNSEFSNEFDVLYNNITSNQAPGLDEYEKSVFLTKAQDEIVKAYFNPRLNKPQEGFDDSPIRQTNFSTLIKTETLKTSNTDPFDRRAKVFEYPEDLFISLNEKLQVEHEGKTVDYTVVPISYEEYNRLTQKPYKYPTKNQAWRLITGRIKMDKTTGVASGSYSPSIGEPTYVLSTRSNYNKKVTLIIKTPLISTGASVPPKVTDETSEGVTITCVVASGGSMMDYCQSYITNPENSLKNGGIDITEYFEPFIDSTGRLTWPPFQAPTALNTLLYNIENPGGSPAKDTSIIEVIGNFFDETPTYTIRYIAALSPIILTDLDTIDDNLSINGEFEYKECKLPKELHQEILQRAVELAKAAYIGDLNTQVALGVNSATDKGLIATS